MLHGGLRDETVQNRGENKDSTGVGHQLQRGRHDPGGGDQSADHRGTNRSKRLSQLLPSRFWTVSLTRLIQRIAGIQKRVLYKPLSSRHELASRLSRSPARRESRHVRPLWLSRRAPVQLSDRSSQEGRGGVR